jgi:cyclopropane fatty-acyl-phospholipid synthase-like methyltransferase
LGHFDEPQPDLIAAFSQGVIQGPSILDVGCGTGDNAVYLAQGGFRTIGVTFSAAAIALAERNARSASVDARFGQA